MWGGGDLGTHGVIWFFFFRQKTAYEMLRSLVGSEMCIRDSLYAVPDLYFDIRSGAEVWLAVSITNDDPSGTPSLSLIHI